MEQITLRRIGGTLYFRVPVDFVRANSLSPGDSLYWIPGKDTVTLRVIKREVLAELFGKTEGPAPTETAAKRDSILNKPGYAAVATVTAVTTVAQGTSHMLLTGYQLAQLVWMRIPCNEVTERARGK
jgi:hypothetical protein